MASVPLQEPGTVQVGCVSRAASSASMAAICAWIGALAGEPGRARARLTRQLAPGPLQLAGGQTCGVVMPLGGRAGLPWRACLVRRGPRPAHAGRAYGSARCCPGTGLSWLRWPADCRSAAMSGCP
jgi:hypothetical protein